MSRSNSTAASSGHDPREMCYAREQSDDDDDGDDEQAELLDLAEAHLRLLMEMSSQSDAELHAQAQHIDDFWSAVATTRGGNSANEPINLPACLPPFKAATAPKQRLADSAAAIAPPAGSNAGRLVLRSDCEPTIAYADIVAAGNHCFKFEVTLRHELALRTVISELRTKRTPMHYVAALKMLTGYGPVVRRVHEDDHLVVVICLVGAICLHCAFDVQSESALEDATLTLRGFVLATAIL